MASVTLKGVTKIFEGNVVAVRDLNLHVEDGEFIVLVGPSGCGKSTILRLIAGLETPTTGEIYIGDKLVNDVPPKDRNVAMVFQNYALYPHMTVYDNMAFALRLRRYRRDYIHERVEKASTMLNIRKFWSRRPRDLSGGEQQRVAVGRAIVRNPAVFLFDEPLSNLDAKLRVQTRAELSALHKELGTTMIYVTHDQIEAMTMGQRIVVLNEGEIQQIAPAMQLYNEPANKFVAGFIGSPPMNFVTGKIVQAEGLRFVAPPINLPLPESWRSKLLPYTGKSVILGIRPEDVQHSTDGFQSTIKLIEPLGHETLLYLDVGPHSIVARVAPHHAYRIGDSITIKFNPTRLHFFDSTTENRI